MKSHPSSSNKSTKPHPPRRPAPPPRRSVASMLPTSKARLTSTQVIDQDWTAVPRPLATREQVGTHLLGLPQSIRRTLVYVKSGTITSTNGAYAEVTYYLNSAYNANSPQATGYSKYMAFYSKCFGIRARYRLLGTMNTIAANQSYTVGTVITTNTTAFANADKAIANGMCHYRVVYANPDRFEFHGSLDVAYFLNKPKILDDPQLFSTASTDPSQVIVLHVFGAATTGIVTASIAWNLEVEMDVVLTDPIPFT